jgi:hypothetical protein
MKHEIETADGRQEGTVLHKDESFLFLRLPGGKGEMVYPWDSVLGVRGYAGGKWSSVKLDVFKKVK